MIAGDSQSNEPWASKMNAEELKELIEAGRISRIKRSEVTTQWDRLVVQNRVALPVCVDCSTSKKEDEEDLEVFNEDGFLLGLLCLTTRYASVDLRQLSDWQFVAYLTEITMERYDQPYQFQNDYLVLEIDDYEEYENEYRRSAPIWGNFVHLDPSAKTRIVCRDTTALVAKRDLFQPTPHHEATLQRAIEASHPYDRFLKLYHQLELLFDWTVVRRIQTMGNEISEFGNILSEYKADDLPRLKELLRAYCDETTAIASALVLCLNYEQTAYDMFQKFSKGGNPLAEEDRWRSFWELMQMGCSFEEARKKKWLPDQEPQYRRLLLEITAYWIFRIRCSIAHARIGEYILTEADQEFVVNFGEPLLKCVLCELLTNANLKALR